MPQSTRANDDEPQYPGQQETPADAHPRHSRQGIGGPRTPPPDPRTRRRTLRAARPASGRIEQHPTARPVRIGRVETTAMSVAEQQEAIAALAALLAHQLSDQRPDDQPDHPPQEQPPDPSDCAPT
jgi:hypothetical protein